MYRIGYVDDEEAWGNLFFQYFQDDFKIELLKLDDETNLDSLLDEIFELDLDMLVIDFRLDETGCVDFNGDQLVDRIKKRNKFYPMIILTSHETDALDHLSDANLVNDKDELPKKIPTFTKKIKNIANNYQSKIHTSKEKLKQLEEKRNVSGLSPTEEHKYVELNNIIDNISNAEGHLSRTFYSEDTNRKLDDILDKMENILNKLPNSNHE